jgi:hypothetical protein
MVAASTGNPHVVTDRFLDVTARSFLPIPITCKQVDEHFLEVVFGVTVIDMPGKKLLRQRCGTLQPGKPPRSCAPSLKARLNIAIIVYGARM